MQKIELVSKKDQNVWHCEGILMPKCLKMNFCLISGLQFVPSKVMKNQSKPVALVDINLLPDATYVDKNAL